MRTPIQAGLALGLAIVAWPAPARADGILDWLNKKVESVLSDDKKDERRTQDMDHYLGLLTAPRTDGQRPPPSTPRPASPLTVQEALHEAIGNWDTTDPDERMFDEGAYTLSLGASRLGFRLPYRTLGALAAAIAATEHATLVLETRLRMGTDDLTVSRLHAQLEELMLMIQGTHQLLVESRALLEEAQGTSLRTSQQMDELVRQEGRLHTLPIIVASLQALEKSSADLGSAISAQGSCVSFLRTAFQGLKGQLGQLDDYVASVPHIPPDLLTLRDRPTAIENVRREVGGARTALINATQVLHSALELIRTNLGGLMQVLATLAAEPGSHAPAGAALPLGSVNGPLAHVSAALVATESRLAARQIQLSGWALAIRTHRNTTVALDDLPSWVMRQSSLPGRDRWTEYSLLPEGEAQVDQVVESLREDLGGRAPTRVQSHRAEQQRLDRALGDEADAAPHGRPMRSLPAPAAALPPPSTQDAAIAAPPAQDAAAAPPVAQDTGTTAPGGRETVVSAPTVQAAGVATPPAVTDPVDGGRGDAGANPGASRTVIEEAPVSDGAPAGSSGGESGVTGSGTGGAAARASDGAATGAALRSGTGSVPAGERTSGPTRITTQPYRLPGWY